MFARMYGIDPKSPIISHILAPYRRMAIGVKNTAHIISTTNDTASVIVPVINNEILYKPGLRFNARSF